MTLSFIHSLHLFFLVVATAEGQQEFTVRLNSYARIVPPYKTAWQFSPFTTIALSVKIKEVESASGTLFYYQSSDKKITHPAYSGPGVSPTWWFGIVFVLSGHVHFVTCTDDGERNPPVVTHLINENKLRPYEYNYIQLFKANDVYKLVVNKESQTTTHNGPSITNADSIVLGDIVQQRTPCNEETDGVPEYSSGRSVWREKVPREVVKALVGCVKDIRVLNNGELVYFNLVNRTNILACGLKGECKIDKKTFWAENKDIIVGILGFLGACVIILVILLSLHGLLKYLEKIREKQEMKGPLHPEALKSTAAHSVHFGDEDAVSIPYGPKMGPSTPAMNVQYGMTRSMHQPYEDRARSTPVPQQPFRDPRNMQPQFGWQTPQTSTQNASSIAAMSRPMGESSRTSSVVWEQQLGGNAANAYGEVQRPLNKSTGQLF